MENVKKIRLCQNSRWYFQYTQKKLFKNLFVSRDQNIQKIYPETRRMVFIKLKHQKPKIVQLLRMLDLHLKQLMYRNIFNYNLLNFCNKIEISIVRSKHR